MPRRRPARLSIGRTQEHALAAAIRVGVDVHAIHTGSGRRATIEGPARNSKWRVTVEPLAGPSRLIDASLTGAVLTTRTGPLE